MPPKYANGHISATGDPIHFMFGSRVGFSGTADRTALFRPTVRMNPRCGHRHVGKISNGDISATVRPIHFMFCSRVGFSETADLMALFSIQIDSNKFKMAAAAILDNFEWPYLRNGSRSTYIARASRGHLCDSTAFLFKPKRKSFIEAASIHEKTVTLYTLP